MKKQPFRLQLTAILAPLFFLACHNEPKGDQQPPATTTTVAAAPTVALKPPFNIDSMPRVDVVVAYPAVYGGDINVFEFYDKNGRFIKKMSLKDFPTKHPLLHLDFPLKKDSNMFIYTKPYGDFVKFNQLGNPIRTLVPPGKRTREFKKLEKYGFKVKKPETAQCVIDYGKKGFVTYPACKYLMVVENAVVMPYRDHELEDSEQSNALLEAAWISVYNAQGEMIKEFPLPDKNISWACISDNARYILSESEFTIFGQDGFLDGRKGKHILIDTDTRQIIDFDLTPDGGQTYCDMYAENYFQLYRTPSTRIYINPYERTVLTKSYDKKDLLINEFQSFSGFKGIVDDLSTFDTMRF